MVRCEIITIGNELISGRTLDLNAWYAAGKLTASGLQVTRITSIGDDDELVSQSLKNAMEASRFVIVTGGLGSTGDDLTSKIVAKALSRPLCLDRQMLDIIECRAKMRGLEMCPSLEKMAWVPHGSKRLSPESNVCGFSLEEEGVRFYFLPGVPDQMRHLIDKVVIPEIRELFEPLPQANHRTLKVYGLSEPSIAEIFKELKDKMEGALLGFYPHFPENHITVSVTGRDADTVSIQLDRIEKQIKARIGPCVFASGNTTMAEVVGEALKARHLTVSLAESCTGGLIGHLLTNVSGSSSYFPGGIVSYSNRAKMDLLGVEPGTLEKAGAVSDETVREMANGVRKKMRAHVGVAVSGIAGPEGGSPEKPVGTVHIGLASEKDTVSKKYRFWGKRREIKLNSAMMALDWMRRYCSGDPFLPGV